MPDDRLDNAALDTLEISRENEEGRPLHGGPMQDKDGNTERGRLERAERLYTDYFKNTLMYSAKQFGHRFRLARLVFVRIVGV